MYYKILSKDMKHYNMQYHEGLNTNCEKTIYDDKCGSGLFFTNEKHIMEFCNFGDLIADVILPDGEKISECENKYKVHQIILSNIRPLWTVETFEDLIQKGVDIHVDEDWCLRFAARNGHFEIVKYLVERGADIHADFDYSLRCAAENGHFEIVKLLVEHGANIHADYNYALRWARVYDHTEIVDYLESL